VLKSGFTSSNAPTDRHSFLQWALMYLVSATIQGCSSAPTNDDAGWIGYTEKGQASFYADRHQFKKTASGELYNHDLKTAAHKKMPFGSKINVTNVNNGRSVIVVVNDRGPFVNGRIVDLSKSAFSSIGNTSLGLISVQIEVIE
jgi:rare lipoprotein A